MAAFGTIGAAPSRGALNRGIRSVAPTGPLIWRRRRPANPNDPVISPARVNDRLRACRRGAALAASRDLGLVPSTLRRVLAGAWANPEIPARVDAWLDLHAHEWPTRPTVEAERLRVRHGFALLRHGARAQCARDLGVSETAITLTLQGAQSRSVLWRLGPWLASPVATTWLDLPADAGDLRRCALRARMRLLGKGALKRAASALDVRYNTLIKVLNGTRRNPALLDRLASWAAQQA